jgi:hypothetical protein
MTASDEAFSEFWKAWHSMDPADLREAGAPTSKEIWSHAWKEAVRLEREACAQLIEWNHKLRLAAAIRARSQEGQG